LKALFIKNLLDPPIDVGVEKIIVHPGYAPNSISKQNDIAIIKLDKVIQFSDYIRPICLPEIEHDEPLSPGTKMFVTGFGRTDLCKLLVNLRELNVKHYLISSSQRIQCANF
jgi:hypothetical protein